MKKAWLNLGQAFVMSLLLCTMSCGRIGYELLDLESDSQGEDTDSGVDIGSESDGPGTDTIMDTGGDSGSGTSTLNDTGQDSGSGGDTDTQSDTGQDSGSGGDTGWETSTDSQCSGQPDFAACAVVTVPDRFYDICVEGLCVSPGCGDTSCNVPGPHFLLADTHQRVCYDDTSLMTCPLPGQEFFGQDSQYGWDLTHDASERYTRATPVANQSVVQDNVTGLVWQGCSAGLSGGNCEIGVNSEHTWEAALAYCDSLAWAGHTDWRLPDHYEHLSIVDRGRVEPAVDRVFFPETVSDRFWSSSSYGYNLGHAWCIDLFDGFMDDADKDLSFRVRCVRSGPFQARRFEALTLFGDRVVRDKVNKLDWQGCAAGRSGNDCATGTAGVYKWKSALAYCEGLSFGGHTDWRLPNVIELQSIGDQRRTNPSVDPVMFPVTPIHAFWSSSSNPLYLYLAWGVSFSAGYVIYGAKNFDYRVRCVRSGN